MLAGGVAPHGSTAAAQTAETASAALDILRRFVSVDVHTHGGTTGILSKAPPNDDLANGRAEFDPGMSPARGRMRRPHATEDTVKQAAEVATIPSLLSHTATAGSRATGPTSLKARQISPDHARIIAETGGSIGIWHFFPGLDKYVEGIKEMVDVVDVDHVSIGTDQQVAPGSVQDYAQWVQLVVAMARRLHSGRSRQSYGRQLYAHLSCCGRLTRNSEPERDRYVNRKLNVER